MSVSIFWDIFFLGMLYLAFRNPGLEFDIQDYNFWFFIFNYLLSGLEDFWRHKLEFLSSFWCCYTLFINVVLIAGAGLLSGVGSTIMVTLTERKLAETTPSTLG